MLFNSIYFNVIRYSIFNFDHRLIIVH